MYQYSVGTVLQGYTARRSSVKEPKRAMVNYCSHHFCCRVKVKVKLKETLKERLKEKLKETAENATVGQGTDLMVHLISCTVCHIYY